MNSLKLVDEFPDEFVVQVDLQPLTSGGFDEVPDWVDLQPVYQVEDCKLCFGSAVLTVFVRLSQTEFCLQFNSFSMFAINAISEHLVLLSKL